MKKQINQQQIDSILGLLQSYNIGVKDYSSAVRLFDSLPVVSEEAKPHVEAIQTDESKKEDTSN